MKKSAVVVGVICFVISISVVEPGVQGRPGQTEREKALASLVEAERAFSRTSDEKGIREAFLTWLAPDAVVFRPLPVEGRPVYESMDPANPAHLVWEPEVAEIAASGELGYTSGPYRMGPQRGAEPTRFGHYVSVWKKQPDGAWRVFLDIGVQHDRPASSAPVTNVASPPAPADVEALSPEALRDAEQAVGNIGGRFESTVGARGYRKALAELATEDVRVYRPGRFPTAGKARIKDLVAPSSGLIVDPGSQRRLGRYQALVAWSGDLACTYGTSEYAKTTSDVETTSFLKIWRKDRSGAWKISLDIEIPVPAEAKRTG